MRVGEWGELRKERRNGRGLGKGKYSGGIWIRIGRFLGELLGFYVSWYY
jgi:hypothetical protein